MKTWAWVLGNPEDKLEAEGKLSDECDPAIGNLRRIQILSGI
jgi:hypothetical protein